MCGFALEFAYHNAALPADLESLGRMDEAMRARGPDGHGVWQSPCARVAAVHRRLAVIDPGPGGHQPMRDERHNLTLVYNGEIYNYRALRASLEARGHTFDSDSDSEVVLAMYREHGEAMLHALRGMFAIALWDGEREQLLLARDAYGIKPLYYADDGWTVRVASQARVLSTARGVDARPDAAGWAGFFLFGSVPEPFTTYRGVHAVPAGSVLRVNCAGVQAPRAWFRVCEHLEQHQHMTTPVNVDSQLLREALRDSVAAHLVADVPVGLFLSAGVDSAALLAISQDLGYRELQTVTVGFEEFRGQARDEVPMAAALARRYRVRHHVREVTREEFQADMPALLRAMDQPSIDGVNTWFASKAARELGLKVALSGVGGDELFGGYPSFRQVPRLLRYAGVAAHIPCLGAASRALLTPALRAVRVTPKWAGLLEYGTSVERAYLLRRALYMPYELPRIMGAATAREGLARLHPVSALSRLLTPRPKHAFARVLALESGSYLRNQLLRDCDWAGMAHSLEIRVPLVDAQLLRALAPWLARLRAPPGKQLLASAGDRTLPRAVSRRRKTGFEIPMTHWLNAQRGTNVGGHGTRRWAHQVAEAFAA